MSSPIMAPELSLALQYLGVQFCHIVHAVQQQDNPSHWLDDWYQYVLAEVMSGMLAGASTLLTMDLGYFGASASAMMSYVNMDNMTPSNLLQYMSTINPFKALHLECNVQLPNAMPNCWWRKDTSTVELGYEWQPLKAIIAEAKEFFTGVGNDNLAVPLLIYSEHMIKADREALCTFCTQCLEETDAKLNWLAGVILHSEEQMRSLEAVTKSRDALWDGWATLVQDQWLNNLAK
ncbi:hypothetical protein J3A83DRAFT_4387488 [Scleroderma citrinum]